MPFSICNCSTGFIIAALAITAMVLFLSQSVTDARNVFASNATQTTDNKISDIPPVRLVYANHTYSMLPFVVVDQDGVRKLNFPQLADEYKPLVQIPSDATFSVEFANKPREVNAFGIDYDADSTEVNPLTKIGKYQYSVGKLNGILTVEVRAIYDDGKYVTYTGLVKINQPMKDLGGNPSHLNPSGNQSGIPDIFS